MVYMRVGPGGSIDAAKPVKEGLSREATQQILHICNAEEVSAVARCICNCQQQNVA